MADDRRREIDPAEAEAGIWAAGRRMELSIEQIKDAVRDHRRIGRATLADDIARAVAVAEKSAVDKGEPWDEAAQEKAVDVGYLSHVHGLVVLRAEIEKRYPGGMETIEFVDSGERQEDGVIGKQMRYGWPKPGAVIGKDGPFSAN